VNQTGGFRSRINVNSTSAGWAGCRQIGSGRSDDHTSLAVLARRATQLRPLRFRMISMTQRVPGRRIRRRDPPERTSSRRRRASRRAYRLLPKLDSNRSHARDHALSAACRRFSPALVKRNTLARRSDVLVSIAKQPVALQRLHIAPESAAVQDHVPGQGIDHERALVFQLGQYGELRRAQTDGREILIVKLRDVRSTCSPPLYAWRASHILGSKRVYAHT
jgi:hypothetical protein